MSYLAQNGVARLIRSWGATRSRVLPVDIQTIKLILTQEVDHAGDEGLAVGRTGHHGGESEERPHQSQPAYTCFIKNTIKSEVCLILTWQCQSSILQWPAGSSVYCYCKQTRKKHLTQGGFYYYLYDFAPLFTYLP